MLLNEDINFLDMQQFLRLPSVITASLAFGKAKMLANSWA